MTRFTIFLCIAVLFFAAGCATKALEVDPGNFSIEALEPASNRPSAAEVKRDKPRVAIFPLELFRSNSELTSNEAKLLEPSMRSELEAALLDAGKVSLLDRNLALRLRGALAEYEKTGKTPNQFKQADYLVITNIDLTSADREYRPPATNSKGRIIPGVCITKAKVSGVIKVYDILGNDTSDIEKIDGGATDIDESAACAPMSASQERAIFQQAAKKAANGARGFLRTFFAPKGYVVEKRHDGKAWVFKVTTDGKSMAQYKTVKIFDRHLAKNALTGELEQDTLSVGTARVTDQVGEKFIWIYVDDPNVAKRVRLGHLVRPDSIGKDPLNFLKESLL